MLAQNPSSKQTVKQDCEQNAFDRLLPRLSRERHGLGMIVIADALFSTEVENRTRFASWHCILSKIARIRAKQMLFRWRRNVPLNKSTGRERLITVVEQTEIKVNGAETRWTWATDLPVTSAQTAYEVAKLGRRRWAIETFKTLKSADGYHCMVQSTSART